MYQINAISPTTLLSPIMGNIYNSSGVVQNPFTINQYGDVTLTVGATSTSGDLTITSSNFTTSYAANSETIEGTSVASMDLTITATASGNITQTREPETSDFSGYVDLTELFGNDFNFVFDSGGTATINNLPSTKTLSLTGTIQIDTYGTANTTSNLDLDDIFSVAGGSSSGGSILLAPEATGSGGYINIGFLTYNDGTYSTSNGKVIYVGSADNTNITGTGTLYGNFYGNSINDITLAITPGTGNTAGTSCFDNMTITKGTLSGTDSSQDLTYTWTAQFDEVITSSSTPIFNVQVSLTNEP